MLSHIWSCISTALANNDMVDIKVPNKLLHSAHQGCKKPIVHREELRYVSVFA